HVGSNLALGFFSVSANGVLAYRSGDAGGGRQLVWFDREGKPLGTVGSQATHNGVSLSPDGKRAAVEVYGASGNWDLWMIDIARNVPSRFTFDPGTDMFPVWSPDSSRLTFASDRGKAPGFMSLYQKNAGTSSDERLLYSRPDLVSVRPFDWSPDGKYI